MSGCCVAAVWDLKYKRYRQCHLPSVYDGKKKSIWCHVHIDYEPKPPRWSDIEGTKPGPPKPEPSSTSKPPPLSPPSKPPPSEPQPPSIIIINQLEVDIRKLTEAVMRLEMKVAKQQSLLLQQQTSLTEIGTTVVRQGDTLNKFAESLEIEAPDTQPVVDQLRNLTRALQNLQIEPSSAPVKLE